MIQEEHSMNANNTTEIEGLPSLYQRENKNPFLDRKVSVTRLLPLHNSVVARKKSVFATPQEILLNRQAKKLFDIGQGGMSLPGLSYLSTRVHSPAKSKETNRLAAQISNPKPLNEMSQEALNKQFPLFQVTNVSEFDNQINFFKENEEGGQHNEDDKKHKTQMKINFTSKRRKDSIVVDLIQLQGKNTFIQPQFMQERGSMCITELWPESMKKELVKSHQQSHKKIQNASNLRVHNSDKSFMSVFRPEKSKHNMEVQQNVRDLTSNMVLSKFTEQNVIGVFGLMNESKNNKILAKQRTFISNSPTHQQLKSGEQTPKNDFSTFQNSITPQQNQHKNINNSTKLSRLNFYNSAVMPSSPKSHNKQNLNQFSHHLSQRHLQLQQKGNQKETQLQLPHSPKKLNKSSYSNASQYKSFQQQPELNQQSIYLKNSQLNTDSMNKLDLLKFECEEELENNLQLEKSININLKDMNGRLSTLLSKLS